MKKLLIAAMASLAFGGVASADDHSQTLSLSRTVLMPTVSGALFVTLLKLLLKTLAPT